MVRFKLVGRRWGTVFLGVQASITWTLTAVNESTSERYLFRKIVVE